MPQLKPDHNSPREGEEAEIQRQIAADQGDSARGGHRNAVRSAIEVDPELVEWSRRTRGRQKTPTKVAVYERLDAETVHAHSRQRVGMTNEAQ